MSGHRTEELHSLVERWARIVTEVERGYTLTFDDYLNDLDLRHRIAAHEKDREFDDATRETLASADARFRAVSEPVSECVWGGENALEEGWGSGVEWYYFRMPVERPDDW